ncbi:hypothetical protein [Enorma massiliensis]|uniref:hypothetical protein n=1 Tax=Enorma massiliensis TaxID=1472761 RepID=UPI0023F30CF8|nr:hypothetical protein [Enorma massiliensis]
MSIIKSFSVGNGDLFYIKHGTDNFTIIDCDLYQDRSDAILAELQHAASDKEIRRFISTHPDEDHYHGIERIEECGLCENFYCVQNNICKDDSASFECYKKLRDHESRAYHIYKGCSRRWLNQNSDDRGSSGINVLWPIVEDGRFLEQLRKANNGGEVNNISPIIKYSLKDGVTAIWMGDLEKGFMNEIVDDINIPRADILFAPHHGRKSGHVPTKWLEDMSPKIIVVGEAPSEDLCYYENYNTITQNTAGDIEFECVDHRVHVRVSKGNLEYTFLKNLDVSGRVTSTGEYLWYVGSIETYA